MHKGAERQADGPLGNRVPFSPGLHPSCALKPAVFQGNNISNTAVAVCALRDYSVSDLEVTQVLSPLPELRVVCLRFLLEHK